ncbi:ATP-binding protein [Candidatus Desulfosporosinus nitrosoreducens]|uniref:ATP-binding protein n=1 Tax=Candidatus Desulfosporosinus nitrosoreducens TaxID=3401928 RepID=UPI00280B73EF|nr:ATP-binding protein [Desulfosporosinus sp. PR]
MFDGVKRYLKVWPDLINSNSQAKGFCLVGTPGVGKTMLSCIIAKDMIVKNIAVVFVPSTDLIAELKQAQFEKDRDNIEAKIDALAKAPALILDDIGKEKITEWVQAMYYRLIDLRYRNNLLTGFSSNYYPKELEDMLGDYGGPTMSRLLGMSKNFILNCDDFDHRIEE